MHIKSCYDMVWDYELADKEGKRIGMAIEAVFRVLKREIRVEKDGYYNRIYVLTCQHP